ncbi:MAG: cyclic nucleotide-binding domain-containing protein [Bacteroidetes bacterium]|nr:cyclic nucleotide-binding domain-containing protein [Bacteroidota bacterium]MBU1577891.1 cyclic nucleotide-binding domain-containing protein [Bacteroidota bacterium]MBU2466703.1 cyclic nucleotide-binding domain-containing protein [Bacteroidota bacterium]MBU2558475.1 cyclic nucleotide-binding domain-containing protein [Bacteroidota bacterium]
MEKKVIEIAQRVILLKKIPVFNPLDQDALSELAALLVERKTRAQEPIFRKGDRGENMYILVEGEVRVHDGNHVIARLQAGQVFGEYALFDTENRSASVTTEKPGLVLVLDRSSLMDFLKRFPELLLGMLQLQIKRMRDMNDLEEKLSKSYLKISKQKQEIEAQHEAIKLQKNLLETQNISLEDLNAQKKQLLSVIIHGLKNPMTSVQMMADLLDQHKQFSDDECEYLAILKQSLNRMNQVINDLIQTNQDDEASLKRLRPINLREAIAEVIQLHRQQIRLKKLDVELPDSALTSMLHESYFAQLLDQLLLWVIGEAEPETSVSIEVKERETVILEVSFQMKTGFETPASQSALAETLFATASEVLDRFLFIRTLQELSGIEVRLKPMKATKSMLYIDLNQHSI